jgi:hypothetical protein
MTEQIYDFSRHLDYKKFGEMIEQLQDHGRSAEIHAMAREHGYLGKDLVNLVIPEPQWAITGWLATGLNGLMAGQPKTFKSTIMLDMAFSLATGRRFLGLYPVLQDPAPVIYLQEENTIEDMRSHLHSLYERIGMGQVGELSYPTAKREGNLQHVFQWEVQPKNPPNHDVRVFTRRGWTVEDENLDWLAHRIVEEEAQWVIIDPFYKVTPPGMSLNSDETISLMTRKLDMLSEQTNCNIVMVHHQNKDKAAKGGSKVMGSNLIWGWAGQTMWLDRGAEVDTVREGERQTLHRVSVEHDFRSMAPLRSHTHLEYSGDALWTEIPRELAIKGGRPPSLDKAEGVERIKALEATGQDAMHDKAFVAEMAKDFDRTPRSIRNWITDARKDDAL